MTTGEMSFVGRQGGKSLARAVGALPFDRTPIRKFGGSVKKAVGALFAAPTKDGKFSFKGDFFGEEYAAARDKEITHDLRYPEWNQNVRVIPPGEGISPAEEMTVSKKIQNLGIPLPYLRNGKINWAKFGFKNFENSARVFLNDLRTNEYEMLKMVLLKGQQDGGTAEEKADLGKFVNVATGYGTLGKHLEPAMPVLSGVFFSPRNVAAGFQYTLAEPLKLLAPSKLRGEGHGSARVRKAIAKHYAQTFLGYASFIALGAAAGADIEKDPKSADFMKLKFGDTRVDLLGGLSQMTTFISRMVTGKTKTGSGEVTTLKANDPDHPYGGSTRSDVAKSFFRNKLAPNWSLVYSYLEGENAVGEAFSLSNEGKNAGPITYQDIYKAMEEQGVPKATAMSIVAFFGAGLQTYKQKQTKGLTKPKLPTAGLVTVR